MLQHITPINTTPENYLANLTIEIYLSSNYDLGLYYYRFYYYFEVLILFQIGFIIILHLFQTINSKLYIENYLEHVGHLASLYSITIVIFGYIFITSIRLIQAAISHHT